MRRAMVSLCAKRADAGLRCRDDFGCLFSRFNARMHVRKRTRAGLNKYPRSFHFYGTAYFTAASFRGMEFRGEKDSPTRIYVNIELSLRYRGTLTLSFLYFHYSARS